MALIPRRIVCPECGIETQVLAGDGVVSGFTLGVDEVELRCIHEDKFNCPNIRAVADQIRDEMAAS